MEKIEQSATEKREIATRICIEKSDVGTSQHATEIRMYFRNSSLSHSFRSNIHDDDGECRLWAGFSSVFGTIFYVFCLHLFFLLRCSSWWVCERTSTSVLYSINSQCTRCSCKPCQFTLYSSFLFRHTHTHCSIKHSTTSCTRCARVSLQTYFFSQSYRAFLVLITSVSLRCQATKPKHLSIA